MRGREFKDALFAQFAQVGAAFSSPKRIEIIDLLAQGERNVEVIAREAALTVANTSRHLQVLKAAHLVAARKDGLQVFYRLADPAVLQGYRALQRLAEAYAAGHVAGAISVPLAELERRLSRLPRSRRVVAYCRGPYCVLAAEAVRLLRRRGIEAVRLRDGFPEWRDAGLPVEEGAPAVPRRAREKTR